MTSALRYSIQAFVYKSLAILLFEDTKIINASHKLCYSRLIRKLFTNSRFQLRTDGFMLSFSSFGLSLFFKVTINPEDIVNVVDKNPLRSLRPLGRILQVNKPSKRDRLVRRVTLKSKSPVLPNEKIASSIKTFSCNVR